MTVDALTSPDDWQLVRERVVALMFRTRLTKAELARAVGVSQSTFGKKLDGRVAMTVPELLRVAERIGVHPAVLFADVLPPAPGNANRAGDDVTGPASVRHQGLEPRTRWFTASWLDDDQPERALALVRH